MTTIRIPQTSTATANRDPNEPLILASKFSVDSCMSKTCVSTDNTKINKIIFLIIYQTSTAINCLPLSISATNNFFKCWSSILAHVNSANPCSLYSAGVWFKIAIWWRGRVTTVGCIEEKLLYAHTIMSNSNYKHIYLPPDDVAHTWPEGLGIQVPFL